MKLQDIQKQWGNQFKDSGDFDNILHKLFIESRQSKVINQLNKLRLFSILYIIFNLIIISYTSLTLITNINNLTLVCPLVILNILSIIAIYMNFWQLGSFSKINFSSPITSLQKDLSKLKLIRIKHNRFIFLFCNLYSWLLLTLLFKWNIFSLVSVVWENAPIVVIIHLGMSILWFPFALWLLHKYDSSAGKSNFWSKMQKDSFLTDQSVNSSLNNINSFLLEIKEFEKEESLV